MLKFLLSVLSCCLCRFSTSESCTQTRVVFRSCQHIHLMAFSWNVRQQSSWRTPGGRCNTCGRACCLSDLTLRPWRTGMGVGITSSS